jgi:hypothetical protein
MSRRIPCRLSRSGCLAAFGLLAVLAAAPEPEVEPGVAVLPLLSLESLAQMSWPELECLYRSAEVGPIPEGYTRGRTIYCPCARGSGMKSRLSKAIWHGKLFCAASGMLVNQWCGFQAVHARVCYGPSWLDGQPSIIMDYEGMSPLVWAHVRDEIREVAPGLYLGIMFRRTSCEPEMKLFFVLEACPR